MMYIITISTLLYLCTMSNAQGNCLGICEANSANDGYQRICNANNECELVVCADTSDCTTANYTTCLDGFFGGFTDGGRCIDGCDSDLQCQNEAASNGQTDVSGVYCNGAGFCSSGASCSDTRPCWDEDAICDNGVCKYLYCTMDQECPENLVCGAPLCGFGDCADTIFLCTADLCRTDAQCAANYNDSFVCLVDADPASSGLGVCTDAFCRENSGNCGEGSSCIVGIFDEFSSENFTFPSDIGICLEGTCELDAECAVEYNESFICVVGVNPLLPPDLGFCTNDVCRTDLNCGLGEECIIGEFGEDIPANITLSDDIGTCVVDTIFCSDNNDCPDDTFTCFIGYIDELPADLGICSNVLCTADTQCAANFNDSFICAVGVSPELPSDLGFCTNVVCREDAGNCGEGQVCVVGIVPDDTPDNFTIPDDIGVCSDKLPEGICIDDDQCMTEYNSSFICVMGVIPRLPEDVGFCANGVCREDTDNCGEGEICVIGFFGGEVPDNFTIPDDLGTCVEPECVENGDCGEGAECLDTAIGGVCIIPCDVEDEACGDEGYLCTLVPADAYFCGVPELDTFVCSNETIPEPMVCTEAPTTAVPTTNPTKAPSEEDRSGAVHVLLFGVLGAVFVAMMY